MTICFENCYKPVAKIINICFENCYELVWYDCFSSDENDYSVENISGNEDLNPIIL